MNPSFRFIKPRILALVAAAGVLMALAPALSQAQNNTYYGAGALQSGTKTGVDDSAFGFDALNHNTTGAYNTATGVNALYSNTTGAYNTATGFDALYLNVTGTGNTAIGVQVLYNCTTDGQNTAVGFQSLFSDKVGFGGSPNQNVALGYQALYSSTDGFENLAAGYRALFHGLSGDQNTALGYQALFGITTGVNNIGIGHNAGILLTTGSSNIDIGSAGAAGDTRIIRIGDGSTQTDTYLTGKIHGNGANLTGVPISGVTGSLPGSRIVVGSVTATQLANGAVGASQLAPNVTLAGNTTVGSEISLPATDATGTNGVLNIGGNPFLSAFGTEDTFVGNAGNFSTTGSYNTAVGADSLNFVTNGNENVAVGYGALNADTTGSLDVAVGYGAMASSRSGSLNVAVGYDALNSDLQDQDIVAVGFGALSADQGGGNDTAVGFQALNDNQTGPNNTAFGYQALFAVTAGANNTGIGYEAGSALTTGSNNIDLGDYNPNTDTSDDVAGEANTIRIGEVSTHVATYIAGIYNQSYNANDTPAAVFIDSTGKLGTMSVTPSSRQFKQEIKPMGDASGVILSLKPVTFQYIKPEYDPRGGKEFGLIAEEVDKICPDLVAHNKDGGIYGIRYDAVNAMLLNEFLKEHQRMEEQGRTIAAQGTTIAQQQKAIEELTASLKEQGSLLQKVSAQVQMMKPTPQVVASDR